MARGDVSVAEVTREALARAQSQSPLNALLDVLADQAMTRAAIIDERLTQARRQGDDPAHTIGSLAGVPVVLKDNICLGPDMIEGKEGGGRTTCGSRLLAEYRSPYTATAARKLLDAGAVIIAKSNMDEFAMGSSGENSAFGPTLNPWDHARVPGGSSSGSTTAVSAGIVPVALGSDTGGSIRQPAGFCNLVGIKPTYGRVSRYGLVAYASSLDQIGPLTHTVADAAIMLEVLCGHDEHDTTSLNLPVPDFTTQLDTPVENLVIGIPTQARSSANHPAVRAALESAAFVYRSMGASVIDVDLPNTEHGVAAYYIIATAEASSNLARFDGVRYGKRATLKPGEELFDLYARSRSEGFGPEVQRRIMLGTYVLSAGYYDAYYAAALKVRRLIKQDYDAVFNQGVHAILMPSSPSPAFKVGEKNSDPLSLYLEDVYTVGVNLAGLPAITMPGGFAAEEYPEDSNLGHDESPKGKLLPVGMQLIGPALGEQVLLRVAQIFEAQTNYYERMPSVV
ncbi:MAG: Asp-tRNA(Asn)/Glu-tRNA(Gln) amidotransferase subunit GatA [Pyrinomonadaceae bacterium]|nr:Asp-tRNA(Asn)/Glu-tRNA(Gln) amidotransferase subunit GatA [Phycisphaerales bacterium]